ncbi:MAG: alpha/beta hydrolase [candidate division Zixibacteria bacterium]|nr:alpha/beta hydrolase [candidate division Zixibacteria bacterium]
MHLLLILLGLVLLILLAGRLYTIRHVRRTYITHPPAGKFVDIGPSKVHYIEEGSGTPVVMIHGSDGTLFNFRRSIFDLVSTEFRTIVVDRPGHGYSDTAADQPLTIPYNAGAIREAVRRLGITRPIVVGYSYGGAVALRWASEHPDEIAGLVLISPAGYPEPHYLSVFAYVVGLPLVGPLLANTMFVPIARPQARIWARRAFRPDPLPPDVLDSVLAFSLRPKQFAAFAEEMRHFSHDLAEQSDNYSRTTIPVAILAGEGDILLTPSRQAVRLQSVLPQATLKLFPRTGHEVHYKYREETLAAIREVATKAAFNK